MKATQLISFLQDAIKAYGDLDVCQTDYNEGYARPCIVDGIRYSQNVEILNYDEQKSVFELFSNEED